jgi:prolycopene isomerase
MEMKRRQGGDATSRLASAYDAVVIGAGVGGLSCAGVLAKEGMKVLLVEQHHRPGGYCTSFRRGGYTFDVAINSLSSCNRSGWIGNLLQSLDLWQEIEFVSLNPIKELVFPDLRFSLTAQYEEYLKQLKKIFPLEEKGIEKVFGALEGIFLELKRMPLHFDSDSLKEFSSNYPYFTQYRSATLGQLLDRFLRDERLKGLIFGQCMYTGVSPAKASVINIGSMLIGYLQDGSYQVKGGVQRLSDVLSMGFERWGGHLLFSRRVREILLQDRRAIGVRLDDGQQIAAGAVVSAMDARQTFFQLLRADALGLPLRSRIEAMRPSLSYFMVFLGLDLPLERMGLCHHIDYFSTFDIESIFRSQMAGEVNDKAISIGMVIPTLVDPQLAPPGNHILTISLLVPYSWGGHWSAVKEEVADQLIRVAEKTIPGLSQRIRLREISTPLTLERYTANFQGAAYGWEQSPDQAGPRRLSPRTSIENLYLAGHWTYPGGGVASVSVSGRIAAQEVLRSGS